MFKSKIFPLIVLIVILISCEEDSGEPMCKITSPEDGSIFHVGDKINISWEISGNVVQGWVLVNYGEFRETTKSGSASYQLSNVPGSGGRIIPIAVSVQYSDASTESDLIHVSIAE